MRGGIAVGRNAKLSAVIAKRSEVRALEGKAPLAGGLAAYSFAIRPTGGASFLLPFLDRRH